MRINKIIGTIGVSLLLATSLSGCDFKSLPHDERYQYIDSVLETIDYKTAGDIVKEEIDDGDGVFTPSYKKIFYKDKSSYAKINKKLKKVNDDCSGGGDNSTQKNCTYQGTEIYLNLNEDSSTPVILQVTDSSGGR